MSFPQNDLPNRADNENAPYLVTNGAWQKMHNYIRRITVRDDGGKTSIAKETKNGRIISKAG